MRNMVRAALIISALASGGGAYAQGSAGDRKYVHRHWTADRSSWSGN
jgi:hypothetical protein